jgi:hypothetical protein
LLPRIVNGQLIVTGQDAIGYNLYSKWQSLNDDNLVVEFTKEGKFIVYRDQEKFIEFSFEEVRTPSGLIEIELSLEGDITDPAKSTVQIVNSDRIRIFHWKHGDVLDDAADEYFRTNDLNSFRKLIKRVIEENKSKGSA